MRRTRVVGALPGASRQTREGSGREAKPARQMMRCGAAVCVPGHRRELAAWMVASSDVTPCAALMVMTSRDEFQRRCGFAPRPDRRKSSFACLHMVCAPLLPVCSICGRYEAGSERLRADCACERRWNEQRVALHERWLLLHSFRRIMQMGALAAPMGTGGSTRYCSSFPSYSTGSFLRNYSPHINVQA